MSLEEGLGAPLLIIAFGILFVPVVARRVGIPTAAAEVLFGVTLGLIGRYLLEEKLGWSFELGLEIGFLALIGLLILMFLAGLEVDFNRLETAGPRPLLLGLSGYLLTLAVAVAGVSYLFPLNPAAASVNHLFLGLILSATSVGIVLPVVKEAGIMKKALGQDILIAAAIADFAAIVGLTAYALYLRSGAEGGGQWGLLPMVFIPLLGLFFLLLYRLANELIWRYPRALSRFFCGDDAPETGMRTALALMLLFAGLAAALGQEALLGAFLAGLLLSMLFRRTELLEKKLSAFGYGFFIPIFFIWTGFQFDLADAGFDLGLGDDIGANVTAISLDEYVPELDYRLALIPLAFLLLALQLGSKLAGGMVLALDHSPPKALAGGSLLGANLAIAVAGMEIGIKAGALPASMRSPIILMALLSALIAPVLFNRFNPNRLMGAGKEPGGEVKAKIEGD